MFRSTKRISWHLGNIGAARLMMRQQPAIAWVDATQPEVAALEPLALADPNRHRVDRPIAAHGSSCGDVVARLQVFAVSSGELCRLACDDSRAIHDQGEVGAIT